MSGALPDYEYASFDDFEEMLADRPRNARWELIDGRVVRAMVGARWEHGLIVGNVAFAIEAALRGAGSTCTTFSESFYLKRRELRSQFLPDVMVTCREFEPGETSTDDAVILVEVLSVATAGRDRFEKWNVYRRLPSLRHYVLVEQARPAVEVFDRDRETWTTRLVEGLDSTLDLPALDLTIPLTEIYRRVLPTG